MFIWDFVADTVLGQITDWVYGQIVGFLGSFFAQMGNMGADLFEMEWVQAIVMFFSCLAWALYVTGLVVAGFECGIEYQNGRGSIRETGVNALKGFFAASLFSTVPVELYRLCVSLQASLTRGLSGSGETFGEAAQRILSSLKDAGTWQEAAVSGVFGGISAVDSPILMIFLLILMGYAVIKVFFANLKRGGILLIQISVGSLYLFSVPRGYTDGFISWCKQVVGLCLTAFLQAIVMFFSCLAWALYVTGLVVAGFECGIEYQNGRGSIRETGVNALKGFFAASLFSTVPVELYRLCVSLQASLTRGLSGSGETFGEAAQRILSSLKDAGTWQEAAVSGVFGGISAVDSPILMIFLLILMGYAVIKVFFANLKRGGILLIQISVGSLYLFSVPRGYTDGFISWCKQVVGLCLTAFLQAVILTAGLMAVKDHALLGMGLMLSAGEVPRIAGQFGLDTTTRANVTGAFYAAQGAINLTRSVVQAITVK